MLLFQLHDSIGTNMRTLVFTVLLLTACIANVVAQDNEKIRSSDAAGAIERYEIESKQLAQVYEQKVADLDKAYTDKLKSMTQKLKADLAEIVKQIAANDLDDAVRIRDFYRSLDAPITAPESPMATLKRQTSESKQENAKLKAKLETYNHFHPVVVIEQTVDGENPTMIVLQQNGLILARDSSFEGSWVLKGRSLILTWKSRNGVVVDSNTFDDSFLKFSGTNNNGRKLAGRVLLGTFSTPRVPLKDNLGEQIKD